MGRRGHSTAPTPIGTRVFHNSSSTREHYDSQFFVSKRMCRAWFDIGYGYANTRKHMSYAQVLNKTKFKGGEKPKRDLGIKETGHLVFQNMEKHALKNDTHNKERVLTLMKTRVPQVSRVPGKVNVEAKSDLVINAMRHTPPDNSIVGYNRFQSLCNATHGDASGTKSTDMVSAPVDAGVFNYKQQINRRPVVIVDKVQNYDLKERDARFIVSPEDGCHLGQHVAPRDMLKVMNQTKTRNRVYDIEDKYVASLIRKRVSPGIVKNAKFCSDYINSCKQNKGKFGFVPLTYLLLYDVNQTSTTHQQQHIDVLQAHDLIRQSNTCNFLKCRIPVKSQLKADRWRFYLQGYWDQQLPDLINFGFPLDFDHTAQLISTEDNHKSAIEFSRDVVAYLNEESKYQAILGPFDHKPIQLHLSPFMTREKADSTTRCTIVDLSWPKGYSVNNAVAKNTYLGTTFMLNYPSVDDIVDTLKKLGPGSLMYKIDISRAFRHVRIDPGDINLLGLSHQNSYYIDECLPFGFRHGSVIFQRISDGIRYIMDKKFVHNALFNYIDDLIVCGLPSYIYQSFDYLQHVLRDLGLDISVKKLVAPSTVVTCLGILIDTVARTISLPPGKLAHVQQLCASWDSKKTATKTEYQSLLGSLLYITKCVRPARQFLNRMLDLFRQNYDSKRIFLTPEFF